MNLPIKPMLFALLVAACSQEEAKQKYEAAKSKTGELAALAGESASKGLGADLRHGIAFIRETPAVTSVFSAVVVTTFASSCYGALTPVYVRDLLHGHSATFGVVGVFAGAGTLAGAFACEGLARRHVPASSFMPVGMAMLTVAFAAIALAPMRSVLLAATATAGFSGALIAAASRTVLARQTPIFLRGRVNSMVSMFTGVAQGAGFGLAGILVHPLGIRGVLVMCALVLGAAWTLQVSKSYSSAHQQK